MPPTEPNLATSWGRYPSAAHTRVRAAAWQSDVSFSDATSVLPVGYRRSYGDSCINAGGELLDLRGLDHFLEFNPQTGVLRCEAGVSLADIIRVALPQGWFLPVTPGTKFVSVGGAIANDIHGKNHHRAGTFGCHVRRFELVRSDGQRLECSLEKNSELFFATLGGVGLTGAIAWTEIQLRKVNSAWITAEQIPFRSFEEFAKLSSESDFTFEYTVSWIDCLSPKLRGIFFRGNHAEDGDCSFDERTLPPSLQVPLDLPAIALNRYSMKLFNSSYFHANSMKGSSPRKTDINSFFYPLDAVGNWNRIYGRRGFLQYQCVVPNEQAAAMQEILRVIAESSQGSFLAVLKKFGDRSSGGLLSFPRPGFTLAVDFAMQGDETLRLLDRLDEITRSANGAVYPAKDARMSPETFRASFPRLEEFKRWVDPKMSSSFWRRVNS
jgi:FAD/FMN-containing dehydrogenase